jgi:uncharacterized LabA/DUF88 family protein
MADDTMRLAVLIDADNAQPAIIADLMSEIAKLGAAIVKRIYGDFTSQNLKSWSTVARDHSIQPIQQFANTVGKNASDSALIIDAMDLLHTKKFDGFCIVSSDSDFTRLATRVREDGLLVFGFGEKKTPMSFVAACNRFIYTEILRDRPAGPSKSAAELKDSRLLTLLRDAVEDSAGDDGWAALQLIGQLLNKRRPDFDTRSFGYRNLSSLVEATGLFDLERRGKKGSPQHVFVRAKAAGKRAG